MLRSIFSNFDRVANTSQANSKNNKYKLYNQNIDSLSSLKKWGMSLKAIKCPLTYDATRIEVIQENWLWNPSVNENKYSREVQLKNAVAAAEAYINNDSEARIIYINYLDVRGVAMFMQIISKQPSEVATKIFKEITSYATDGLDLRAKEQYDANKTIQEIFDIHAKKFVESYPQVNNEEKNTTTLMNN